jgi:hypothetical protein
VSDGRRPEHDEAADPAHLRGLEGDDLELTRFADILTALDEGAAAGIDRTEDPSLASLLDTAALVRSSLLASTESARFESFQYDSRRRIQNPLPMPAARKSVTPVAPPWWRRWQFTIAPAATAAAAIITTVFVVGGLSGGAVPANPDAEQQPTRSPAAVAATEAPTVEDVPADTASENLTRLSVEEQVQYLQDLRTKLEARVAAGEPVDAESLDELTTAIDDLTERLATNPDEFQAVTRNSFLATTGLTSVALSQASVSADDASALEAAQASVQDGIVVAAGIVKENPTTSADGVSLDVAPADDD